MSMLAVALVALAAALVAPATSASTHGTTSAPPNIVLILTDDQRWDTMWAMPKTNELIAQHGVSFNNAFVSNPVCCPSRVSILTGEYSHTSGVYSDTGAYGGFESFHGDDSTIATWLDAAGYETALMGRYLNGYDGTYIPPGWDQFIAFSGKARYYEYRLNVNGVLRSFGSEPRDYSTDVLGSQAVSYIDEADPSDPLFLYFAPLAPHRPSTPALRHEGAFSGLPPYRPPSYNEEDVSDKPQWVQNLPLLTPEDQAELDALRIREYETMLAVDDAVGRIGDALRRTGRLRNTMIVYMSDNGYQWGEHRWEGKNAPYEESIRTPLMVRYDPVHATPRTDDRFVVNIDVAPTFADLADVDAPGADGQSFLPLLSDPGLAWRDDFLLEHIGGLVTVYCGVRDQRGYVYVKYEDLEEEFYDLTADPYQLQNSVTDPAYAAIVEELRARLAELCVPPPPDLHL